MVGGKVSTRQAGDTGLIPGLRRKWQPTSVLLPGKSHGQRNLAGYSPWGGKRVLHDLVTKQQQSRPLHKLYLFLYVIQVLLSLSGWTVE